MPMIRALRSIISADGGIARAYSNRNYRLYTGGNILSLMGTWVQRVGVGYLMWELTHSYQWLGYLSAAEFLPSVLAGPLGGVVADRIDRLTVIRISQVIQGLQALAMGIMTLTGWIDQWSVLGLTLLLGITVSFSQPARLSIVTSLVKREDVAAAVAINSMLWNTSRFIGPAIAGAMIVGVGVGWAFVSNALTFVVFLMALSAIRADLPAIARQPGPGLLREIAEGVRYTVGHPAIGPLVLMLVAGSVFVRPFAELLPGLTHTLYNGDATELAYMTSATGVGALIGGIWLSQRGRLTGLTRIVITSLLIFALSVAGFVATTNLILGLLALGVAGFAMVVNGVATQSLVQATTDPAVLSRVLSLYGLSFRAGPSLGALLMGWLAHDIDIRWLIVIGAGLCLLTWAWAWSRRDVLTARCENLPAR